MSADRPDTYLLYGATDSGKTAELGEFAKWEFGRTGCISRLISADSGWDPIEDLIISETNPTGIIEAWSIQGLDNPWAPLIELSEGAWPIVAIGANGKFQLKMVRPEMHNGRIKAADGRAIGQFLIEGLSTIGQTGLEDHARHSRKLSQDVPYQFSSAVTEVEGGKDKVVNMTFASVAMSHYGQVQRFLLEDLVPKFGRAPVNRVVWTAHEQKGVDEFSKDLPAMGPATVGKAAVDKTTYKFGHTFHFEVITEPTKDKNGRDTIRRDFRAWFVSHLDGNPLFAAQKLKWPAKVSLPVERSRELLAKFPGGYIPRTATGMGQWLDFLHGSAQQAGK